MIDGMGWGGSDRGAGATAASYDPAGRVRGRSRRPAGTGRRFSKNASGATLIEFALVAPVLFMLIFGTIEVGALFAANILLKNATYSAARTGRTGYVGAAQTQDSTIRAKLKAQAGALMDPNKLTISSKAYTGFNTLGKSEPFVDANKDGKRNDGENYTDVNKNGRYDADLGANGYGGTSEVVLYTVTYPWTFFTPLIGRLMTNGSPLTLTAHAVVQNEPY